MAHRWLPQKIAEKRTRGVPFFTAQVFQPRGTGEYRPKLRRVVLNAGPGQYSFFTEVQTSTPLSIRSAREQPGYLARSDAEILGD